MASYIERPIVDMTGLQTNSPFIVKETYTINDDNVTGTYTYAFSVLAHQIDWRHTSFAGNDISTYSGGTYTEKLLNAIESYICNHNMTGDINGDVTGNVTGDVTGDVTGNTYGNTYGTVFGDTVNTFLTTIKQDTDDNSTYYLSLVNKTSGSSYTYVDSDGLYYNPNTNTISLKNINATNNVTVGGSLNVSGALGVKGDVEFSNDLTVGDSLNVSGALGVKGDVEFSNDLTVGGSLNVSGALGVEGDVEFSNDLTVGGYLNNNTNITTTGYIKSATLQTTGDATVTGNLTVKGNTTLGDAETNVITIKGDTTFNADVDIDKTLNVDGDTTINGHSTVKGGLFVSTEIPETLTGNANPNVSSNILIGCNNPGNAGLLDFPNDIDNGGYPLVIHSYASNGSFSKDAMVFGPLDIYALKWDATNNKYVSGTLCLQDRNDYFGDVLIGRDLTIRRNTYANTFYGALNGPVQTTNTSTDASYYLSFVNNPLNGMRYSYVDSNLYYNPSTNILSTGQVNASLNGPVQTTNTSTDASYYLSLVNSFTSGMKYSYVDSGIYYNPATNILTATYISVKDGQYTEYTTLEKTQYGLNMKNSNIKNINALYFADAAEDDTEGINFYNSVNGTTTYIDSLFNKNNNLYFCPKRPLGGTVKTNDTFKIDLHKGGRACGGNQTTYKYYKLAETTFTLSSSSTTFDSSLSLNVDEHILGKKIGHGILNILIRCSFNSSQGTSTLENWEIGWSSNSSIPKSSFILTYSKTDNTFTFRLYCYVKGWQAYAVKRLNEVGWGNTQDRWVFFDTKGTTLTNKNILGATTNAENVTCFTVIPESNKKVSTFTSTFLVPVNRDNFVYTNPAYGQIQGRGTATQTIYCIQFPERANTNWCMIFMELSFLQDYSSGNGGKIHISGYTNNTANANWLKTTTTLLGNLNRNTKVYYGIYNNKKTFCITGANIYSTLNVDKVLINDGIRNIDLNDSSASSDNITVTVLTSLPSGMTYIRSTEYTESGFLTSSSQNITGMFSAYPSFTGSFYDKSSVWHHVISVRHRNYKEDGNNYGLLLDSPFDNSKPLYLYKQQNDSWTEGLEIFDDRLLIRKSNGNTSTVGWNTSTQTANTDLLNQINLTYAFWPVLFDANHKLTANVPMYEGFLQWGGKNLSGSLGPVDAALTNFGSANRFAHIPGSCIVVEKTTDGTNWSSISLSNSVKTSVFTNNCTTNQSLYIGNSSATRVDKSKYGIRFTITPTSPLANIYCYLNKIIVDISTNGSGGCKCVVEGQLQSQVEANSTSWTKLGENAELSGWSGLNTINFDSPIQTWGGSSSTKTTQYGKLRFTFTVKSHSSSSSYPGLTVKNIFGYGCMLWGAASNFAKEGLTFRVTPDNADICSEFEGSIYPKSNNTYVLGTSLRRWSNITAYNYNAHTFTYLGSSATSKMIEFYDGTDGNGSGIIIGGGGSVIIGSGESAPNLRSTCSITATNETTYIASDQSIEFFTNCQTIANRKNSHIDLKGRYARSSGGLWINGRDNAVVYQEQSGNSFNSIAAGKTTNGAWTIGTLGNNLWFSYTGDAEYNASNNTNYKNISFTNGGSILPHANGIGNIGESTQSWVDINAFKFIVNHTNDNAGGFFYRNYRAASGTGGWADSVLSFRDSSFNVIATLGMYGTNASLTYLYLGTGDYSSNNNLKIYPDQVRSPHFRPTITNTYNLGASDLKWYNVYATTFNGGLNGPVQTTNTSTDASYYLSFVNNPLNGMRYSYVDSNLYYNPSTNVLTGGKLLRLIDPASDAGKGAGIWLQRAKANDGTYDWQMWIDSGTLKFSYNNTSWYDVFSSNGKNFTMHSGSIITPTNNNEGILPATNNYGQIGSATKKFYRMYASTFYGALSGNASTASKLQTARNIKLTEAVMGDANFDGSSNITITTHLPNKTATATVAGWYRIATTASGVSRSTRIFQIDASISGQHTVCTLIANTNYNSLSSNGIQVLSCSHFGSGGITKARLVYDSAGGYSGKYVYLEVYVAKANTTLNVRSSEGFGWTLQDIAAGSIPSGYASKEVTLSNNTMVSGTFRGALDGNATSATSADKVLTTATSTSATYYISFVNSSSTGMRYSYVDSGLYYNPYTNVLTTTGHINATNGFYETSDERLKDFQEDIEVNFSYLHNIPKKYYSWKDDATYTRHIGTSAQEVQKYYPELVNTDDNGYLTMNYDKLSVVALKAIDVLHEEVTELKKENAELKERLARLEELILNR